MRPSVTEQLEGLRRILAETIAPEIAAPYPAEILGSVMMSLDALTRAWYAVPPYLAWDIAATEALLTKAKPFLDKALAAEIDAALRFAPNPDRPSRHPQLASPIDGEGHESEALPLDGGARGLDPGVGGGDVDTSSKLPENPLKALEERQQRLHALLCRAMPAIASDPALAGTKVRMTAFFRERSDRYPFAMLARPAPKKDA
jgi:hypothetical protein